MNTNNKTAVFANFLNSGHSTYHDATIDDDVIPQFKKIINLENAIDYEKPIARGRWEDIINDRNLKPSEIEKFLNNVNEVPLSYYYLLSHLKVKSKIGSGSFGTAFNASLTMSERDVFVGIQTSPLECTVKISNYLFQNDIIKFIASTNDSGESFKIMDFDSEKLFSDANPKEYLRAIKNMKIECDNARMINEPWRKNTKFYNEQHLLRQFKLESLKEILGEMKYYVHHKGHAHMHTIYHFDPILCILISEPCISTMSRALREQMTDSRLINFNIENDNGMEFIQYTAVQLSWGMKYLIEEIKLVHFDIKPENIFYTINSNRPYNSNSMLSGEQQSIVWKIADFGSMLPVEPGIYTITSGTTMYMPNELHKGWNFPHKLDPIKLMIWAFVYIFVRLCSSVTFSDENDLSTMARNLETYYDNWAKKNVIDEYTCFSDDQYPFFVKIKCLVTELIKLDSFSQPPVVNDQNFFRNRQHVKTAAIFNMYQDMIKSYDKTYSLRVLDSLAELSIWNVYEPGYSRNPSYEDDQFNISRQLQPKRQKSRTEYSIESARSKKARNTEEIDMLLSSLNHRIPIDKSELHSSLELSRGIKLPSDVQQNDDLDLSFFEH